MTNKFELKFTNKSDNPNPTYGSKFASGFDVRAFITEDESKDRSITIKPLSRKLIHTGLYFDFDDVELQVRPRSGLALKKGLSVLNTPGTIDSDYTGEVCIIAINLGNEDIIINNGDKIAQVVVCPVYNGTMVNLTEILGEFTKETDRGDGGFGSTGV